LTIDYSSLCASPSGELSTRVYSISVTAQRTYSAAWCTISGQIRKTRTHQEMR